MQKIRFFHIVVIVILFFILLTSLYYRKTQELSMNSAHEKVNELLLNYQAIRTNVSDSQKEEVYRLENLNIINHDYFHPSLLSSTYNAQKVNEYYNILRKNKGKEPIKLKFVSNNPRNPKNIADAKESKLLKQFNNNEITSYSEVIQKGDKKILYYAIATKKTTHKCMRCHSDPSIAPKDLVKIYGNKNGFHEKVGQIRALLITYYPLDEDFKYANSVFLVLTIITFILLSILLLIIYFFMKRLKNEISEQIVKSNKIEKLSNYLKIHEDELKVLNENLEDRITQEVNKSAKMQEKLFKSEKMAAMGEMIGNIAHQWRQPLSVISTAATGMKMQKEFNVLSDEQFFNACDNINENTQYLSSTIDHFRDFIKGDSKAINFNLKNDTDAFLKLVDFSIKQYNINVILSLQEDVNVKGYPNELIQCFMNLFNNAKDALIEHNDENNRYIFITQTIHENIIIITFKDNAGGIPDDIIDKIFEPYFTTKHKSQGTGLGLHMSYNLIVDGMDGTIEVSNVNFNFNDKECVGAEFKITIPII